MAKPLDDEERDPNWLREEHRSRIEEVQPSMAAHTLQTMAKHLGMLRAAVEGDADTVGRFSRLYVFE